MPQKPRVLGLLVAGPLPALHGTLWPGLSPPLPSPWPHRLSFMEGSSRTGFWLVFVPGMRLPELDPSSSRCSSAQRRGPGCGQCRPVGEAPATRLPGS